MKYTPGTLGTAIKNLGNFTGVTNRLTQAASRYFLNESFTLGEFLEKLPDEEQYKDVREAIVALMRADVDCAPCNTEH